MASRLTIRGLLFVAATALAACGGDDVGFIDAPNIDGPVDAPSIDGPDVDAPIDAPDVDAPDIDAAIDGPDIDAPDIDAAIDAPAIDAPSIDATTDGPPPIDAPSIDAPIDGPPPIDAPAIDAPIDGPPPIDAPIDAPSIDAPIDAPMALPGDTCGNAEPITLTGGMASIASTTLAYTNDYNIGPCTGFTANGPDRVRSITVPPGQRLTASVVPTAGTFDPGIAIIAGPAANCGQIAQACLGGDDQGGDGETDTAIFNNTSTNPLDVLVIVDGFRAAGDAYTLNVAVGAIPATELCSTAPTITLTNGMATVTGTTVDHANDYDPGSACTGYITNGPDAIHQVSVAAGGTLTVTLTPAAAYDAGIYLILGPAAQCDAEPIVCLDGADVELAGDPEIVTYTNMSTAAQTVFIGVDGDIDLSTGDTYGLQVSVTMP